ncbi:MAG: Cobalt-zinc-cadmium resistance protein CzcA; Cation efflux system protein CusA, partial [uncultured Acetobacteraceae bacterium]
AADRRLRAPAQAAGHPLLLRVRGLRPLELHAAEHRGLPGPGAAASRHPHPEPRPERGGDRALRHHPGRGGDGGRSQPHLGALHQPVRPVRRAGAVQLQLHLRPSAAAGAEPVGPAPHTAGGRGARHLAVVAHRRDHALPAGRAAGLLVGGPQDLAGLGARPALQAGGGRGGRHLLRRPVQELQRGGGPAADGGARTEPAAGDRRGAGRQRHGRRGHHPYRRPVRGGAGHRPDPRPRRHPQRRPFGRERRARAAVRRGEGRGGQPPAPRRRRARGRRRRGARHRADAPGRADPAHHPRRAGGGGADQRRRGAAAGRPHRAALRPRGPGEGHDADGGEEHHRGRCADPGDPVAVPRRFPGGAGGGGDHPLRLSVRHPADDGARRERQPAVSRRARLRVAGGRHRDHGGEYLPAPRPRPRSRAASHRAATRLARAFGPVADRAAGRRRGGQGHLLLRPHHHRRLHPAVHARRHRGAHLRPDVEDLRLRHRRRPAGHLHRHACARIGPAARGQPGARHAAGAAAAPGAPAAVRDGHARPRLVPDAGGSPVRRRGLPVLPARRGVPPGAGGGQPLGPRHHARYHLAGGRQRHGEPHPRCAAPIPRGRHRHLAARAAGRRHGQRRFVQRRVLPAAPPAGAVADGAHARRAGAGFPGAAVARVRGRGLLLLAGHQRQRPGSGIRGEGRQRGEGVRAGTRHRHPQGHRGPAGAGDCAGRGGPRHVPVAGPAHRGGSDRPRPRGALRPRNRRRQPSGPGGDRRARGGAPLRAGRRPQLPRHGAAGRALPLQPRRHRPHPRGRAARRDARRRVRDQAGVGHLLHLPRGREPLPAHTFQRARARPREHGGRGAGGGGAAGGTAAGLPPGMGGRVPQPPGRARPPGGGGAGRARPRPRAALRPVQQPARNPAGLRHRADVDHRRRRGPGRGRAQLQRSGRDRISGIVRHHRDGGHHHDVPFQPPAGGRAAVAPGAGPSGRGPDAPGLHDLLRVLHRPAADGAGDRHRRRRAEAPGAGRSGRHRPGAGVHPGRVPGDDRPVRPFAPGPATGTLGRRGRRRAGM